MVKSQYLTKRKRKEPKRKKTKRKKTKRKKINKTTRRKRKIMRGGVLCPICRNDYPTASGGNLFIDMNIECPICIETKESSDFFTLPCGHAFCKECLVGMGFSNKENVPTADPARVGAPPREPQRSASDVDPRHAAPASPSVADPAPAIVSAQLLCTPDSLEPGTDWSSNTPGQAYPPTRTADALACCAACAAQPGCAGAVYNNHQKGCWMKSVDEMANGRPNARANFTTIFSHR